MDIIKAKRSKKTKIENTQLNTFLKTQLFSVLIYIILFIAGTFAALAADLPSKYDYAYSLVIFILCSFATGFFAGLKLRHNGLLVGIIYSLPMNIITVLISFILNEFKASYNLIITSILLIIFAGIGGILAVNKRVRR